VNAVAAFREINNQPIQKIRSPFEEASVVPFNIPKQPLTPPAVPLRRANAVAPAPMWMNRGVSAERRPMFRSPFQDAAMMPMDHSLVSTATSKRTDVPPLERTYAMTFN